MASETMTREDIYREFAKGEDADGLYHVQMDEMADEIIRLRTALAPRYEVCGWQVRRGLSETTTWSVASSFTADQCKELAAKHTEHFGGTAHAIYRRVEGDK